LIEFLWVRRTLICCEGEAQIGVTMPCGGEDRDMAKKPGCDSRAFDVRTFAL
jgi:hypothetical protein